MLYFLPGERANRAGLLAEHGIDRLIDSPEFRETMRGPSGPGLLVADQSLGAELLRFDEKLQQWSPRYGYTSLVGHWCDHRPTPESLARTHQLPGKSLELLDGVRWTIPTLRNWHDDETLQFTCTLPRIMQQDPASGRQVLTKVVPRYRKLWDTSLEIAQVLFDQLTGRERNTAELDDSLADAYVADLLAVNYRVDASVISHLELLSPDLWGEIIRASLDWDTMRVALKNRLSRPS